MKNKTREINTYLFWCINLVVFGLILLMSSFFPYAEDDIWYSGGVHTSDPLEALRIAIEKLYNFYFTWSGRLVGNFFAFYMSIMNKAVYNVCNAIMHVILACIMHAFVSPKKKSPVILLLIYLSIWLFTPEYGMVLIWTNATTIYLWAQIPLLLFALVYYRTIEEQQDYEKKSALVTVVYSIGMLALGILAGNSMEPTAATMAVVGFFWLVRCIRIKRKIRFWEITGIIGFFVGFATSVLSPGSAARAETVREMTVSRNPIVEIAFRLVRETYYTAKFMPVLFGISIALWIVACSIKKKTTDDIAVKGLVSNVRNMIKLRWKEPVFIVAALLSIYMMTFSIAFALRIFLAPTVLLIISMAISLSDIAFELSTIAGDEVLKKLKASVAVIMVFICVFVMTQYVTAMIEMHKTGEPFVKTTIFVEYNQNLF